jgi:hypothetical protein
MRMPTAAEVLSVYLYNQYEVPSSPLSDQFIRAEGVSSTKDGLQNLRMQP